MVARRTVDGEVIEWLAVPESARRLRLAPHPEGGWFRRTWQTSVPVETPTGPRPSGTGILFLLPVGEASAWHKVSSDEVWLWHGPGRLALELGGAGDAPAVERRIVLGGGVEDAVQGIIPAGSWQRTLPGDEEVLVSCVVSPGFSFDDWELADEEGVARNG